VRLDAFPTVHSANAIKVQKARLREMAAELNRADPAAAKPRAS
jgi:hypothetical protein